MAPKWYRYRPPEGLKCETVEDAGTPVRSGELIAGKYVVERVLGQGGMGVVVSATHATLKQRVALKFLLPEACNHPGAVERFLREARAAVQIQSEHVARVSDVGTLESGSPYMVMEYLEGHDLADEIEQRGSLPPQEIAQYMLQACEAIAEAHALTIVHRDLKPANLFLSIRKDGTRSLKVLDFGISKAIQDGDANLTQTASMMGSPLYMAPEQIRNAKSVDARADVWSLGVILHESLSGKAPFGGETLSGVLASIVADPPEPLSSLRPDLPARLAEIVARCLEKDMKKRVQDVAELAELLSPFAPAQAERSVPRIRSLLGRPSQVTTWKDGVVGMAATVVGTTAAAGTGATVAGVTANEGNTSRPWSKTEHVVPVKKTSRPVVMSAIAVSLAALGALMWATLGGDATQPPSAEVEERGQEETESNRKTQAASSPVAVPEAPSPPALEEKAPNEVKQEPVQASAPVSVKPRAPAAPAVPASRPASVTERPMPVGPRPAPVPKPSTPAQESTNPLDGRR